MANYPTRSKSDGACEKIFKAFRRISHPQKPTTSVLYSSGPTSSEVPVIFNHPPPRNTATPIRKTNQVVRFASRNEPMKPLGHGQHHQVAQPKKASSAKVDNADDIFSEYIHRAKAKIRTTSDVGGESGYISGGNGGGGGGGGERSGLKVDSFNDRVSDYINRAKVKIRTTSNVGARRSVSIK